MPDICMCRDTGCSLRAQCYRFTATPDAHRQTYYAISPRPPGTDACRSFYRDYRVTIPVAPTFIPEWNAVEDPQDEDEDESDYDDFDEDEEFPPHDNDDNEDDPLPEGILP